MSNLDKIMAHYTREDQRKADRRATDRRQPSTFLYDPLLDRRWHERRLTERRTWIGS